MPSLSLAETQVVNQMAQLLYDFLPGKSHPYADQNISFAGVARSVGLSHLWMGGSKLPSISILLESTLETQRPQFCKLILEIVRKGLIYRNSKATPITRDQIQVLNELIARLEFKIPELWDPAFLDTLPSPHSQPVQETFVDNSQLDSLKSTMLGFNKLSPQERGFAFEKLLTGLCAIFGLSPRASFRLVGEQIDGSFQIGSDTYLVEAKWLDQQIGLADLLIFREKVESKSSWSRGLFVSHSGFTREGQEAFSRGRSTNLIGMDGQDIYFILDGKMSLTEAINRKARRAAETGKFFVSVYELSLEKAEYD